MAYFGKIKVDNTEYLVGSSLFGKCNSNSTDTLKRVDSGLLGTTFDELIAGITVNIQFVRGNTVESVNLKIGSTTMLPVHGNCKCNENAVLSFTYGQVNGVNHWILNAGEKTATTVMNTYDSTSSEPISGRGVAEAIAPLVPGGNSAANYTVETEIGANPSNSKIPTSNAVATYVNNAFASHDALVYQGTIGNSFALPRDGYSAGWVYRITTAGVYAGQQCEVNDLIMAINDAEEGALSINQNDWIVIQTNISNPVSGPTSAISGHIATFGSNGQTIVDSGYTIETSVPPNAVFTDTQYEEISRVSAITEITTGDDIALASVTNGVLLIKSGLGLRSTTVSTGIQEVT